MSDLISRKDAIDIINERGNAEGAQIKAVFCNAAHLLELIPAVEAEPVRHGTWEMRRKMLEGDHAMLLGTYPTCSQCGHVESAVDKTTPYCPYCGAKMDGGAENENRDH